MLRCQRLRDRIHRHHQGDGTEYRQGPSDEPASGLQLRETFGDAAAGQAGLRSAVQAPFQHSDLFCLLAELPVDDGRLAFQHCTGGWRVVTVWKILLLIFDPAAVKVMGSLFSDPQRFASAAT